MFARSFGRSSNDSLGGFIQRGHDLRDVDRYYSTNNSTYVNQRHLKKELLETNPFLKQSKRHGNSLMMSGQKQMFNQSKITMSYADAIKNTK